MTNEELVKQIRAGKDTVYSMEVLYYQNERYICKIAQKYKGYADMDDLMQEGYFGLYEAVQHYDSDQEVPFITYAYYWIRQSMRRYVNGFYYSITVPEHMMNKVYQYKKLCSSYQMAYGTPPSDREMCYYMELSYRQLDDIKAAMRHVDVKSLDVPISEDEDLYIGDMTAADEDIEKDVLDKVQTEQLKETLWMMVYDLTGNEPEVIHARYKEGLTLKETGKRLNLSAERVRTIEGKALRELRRPKNKSRLSPFIDDYITTHAYRSSCKTFFQTWTSSTEYTAIGLTEL